MTTNTPAITNQYGETWTGIPNGLPITIPVPGRRTGRWSGLPGVIPATPPMLRAAGRRPASERGRRHAGPATHPRAGQLPGGLEPAGRRVPPGTVGVLA